MLVGANANGGCNNNNEELLIENNAKKLQDINNEFLLDSRIYTNYESNISYYTIHIRSDPANNSSTLITSLSITTYSLNMIYSSNSHTLQHSSYTQV